jgi:hypothetical protein
MLSTLQSFINLLKPLCICNVGNKFKIIRQRHSSHLASMLTADHRNTVPRIAQTAIAVCAITTNTACLNVVCTPLSYTQHYHTHTTIIHTHHYHTHNTIIHTTLSYTHTTIIHKSLSYTHHYHTYPLEQTTLRQAIILTSVEPHRSLSATVTDV